MSSAGRWLVFIAVAVLIVAIGLLSSMDTTPSAPEVTTSERAPTKRTDPTKRTTTVSKPSETPKPVVVAKKPARVHGFVRDAYGTPSVGSVVALAEDGKAFVSVKSGARGEFELTDDALAGNGITVDGDRRDFTPLMSGEDRELVLIVGDTREVVGWVLDLAGDPLPGARVTLVSDSAAGTWSAWTDGNGGFRFAHAPPNTLRVTADALDLGSASARLAESDKKRREVTLVVEPSATLIVHGARGISGTVLVRSYDREAHGEDFESKDDELAIMGTLESSLRSYDPSSGRQGLAVLMGQLAKASDDFASEVRQNALAQDPTLEGAPTSDMLVAAATFLEQREPYIYDQLAGAAEGVKKGLNVMEALMRASDEARQARPDLGERAFYNPADAAAEALTKSLGVEARARREDKNIVAKGALDKEITLRGALTYDVSILHSSGAEIVCGEFLVDIGDTVEITCGYTGEGEVTGRVVDPRGRPLSGIQVESYVDTKLFQTETDERGRFSLRLTLPKVVALNVAFTGPGDGPTANRYNVAARAGASIDLGVVIARTRDEAPNPYPSQPYGGVVSEFNLHNNTRGFQFGTVDPMSPVGLEGVEDGASLIAIDEIDATHLAEPDLLSALRGDPGTEVALRLRSIDGELYDIIVQRALIETPKAIIGPE